MAAVSEQFLSISPSECTKQMVDMPSVWHHIEFVCGCSICRLPVFLDVVNDDCGRLPDASVIQMKEMFDCVSQAAASSVYFFCRQVRKEVMCGTVSKEFVWSNFFVCGPIWSIPSTNKACRWWLLSSLSFSCISLFSACPPLIAEQLEKTEIATSG